jgi:hypothetical protein
VRTRCKVFALDQSGVSERWIQNKEYQKQGVGWMKKKLILVALAVAFGGFAFQGAANDVQAQSQSLRYMSCQQLWYARNEIYAEKGICFKTKRARAVFGRGCFPPYGRLTPREQRRVSEIEQMEYRKGCR